MVLGLLRFLLWLLMIKGLVLLQLVDKLWLLLMFLFAKNVVIWSTIIIIATTFLPLTLTLMKIILPRRVNHTLRLLIHGIWISYRLRSITITNIWLKYPPSYIILSTKWILVPLLLSSSPKLILSPFALLLLKEVSALYLSNGMVLLNVVLECCLYLVIDVIGVIIVVRIIILLLFC